MRRTLAITLLLLFCWPMAATALALAQGADATLPACCRRDGAHHCSGNMQMANGSSQTAAAPNPHFHLSALQPRCPAYPAAVTQAHFGRSILSEQTQPISPQLSILESLPQTEARARIALDRSRHKRGPPTQQI